VSIKEGVELNIVSAVWISGHVLEITFSDGVLHKVDFERFLENSIQPEIRKYLDLDAFKGFTINFGNLIWNDYDLCFSIEDLYSGKVLARGNSDRMVAENHAEYGISDEAEK